VQVNTIAPGLAPQEVESQITAPREVRQLENAEAERDRAWIRSKQGETAAAEGSGRPPPNDAADLIQQLRDLAPLLDAYTRQKLLRERKRGDFFGWCDFLRDKGARRQAALHWVASLSPDFKQATVDEQGAELLCVCDPGTGAWVQV
jgi:hypothetical protein